MHVKSSLRTRLARFTHHGVTSANSVEPATPESLPSLFESIGIDRDYAALDLKGLELDLQGWGSEHPIFEDVIREYSLRILIEVGTWKGASLLHMHALSRACNHQTQFICVDTWLGSNAPLWFDPESRASLLLRGGYPTMFRQFVFNVQARGAEADVFPLPMTSTTAARVLRRLGVVADVVYVDGGHEEEEVATDLALYFQLLRDGGAMFGDDYHPRLSGVIRAVDRFAHEQRISLSVTDTKWLLRKPVRRSRSRSVQHA